MHFTIQEILEMSRKNDMRRFYNSKGWRKLSHAVIAENHNECFLCRLKGRVTPATITHHVNELKKRPDLAYSRTFIDDKGKVQRQLMPLCWSCHEEIHERGMFSYLAHFNNEERW